MITGFPALADIPHMYLLLKNMCDRYYPLVTYEGLDTSDPDYIDEEHMEVRVLDKVWLAAVSLRAFVVPADQFFPLTIFGIEQLRDSVLQVSVPSLIEAGLATQDATTREVTLIAKTGDHFTYADGTEYDILLWKRGPSFGNTDVPLYYFANAEKARRDALAYE